MRRSTKKKCAESNGEQQHFTKTVCTRVVQSLSQQILLRFQNFKINDENFYLGKIQTEFSHDDMHVPCMLSNPIKPSSNPMHARMHANHACMCKPWAPLRPNPDYMQSNRT